MKTHSRKSRFLLTLLTGGFLLTFMSFDLMQEKDQKKDPEVSYTKEIVPIIQKHCISCHSSDEERPSGLYMDSYEMLMKGGRHGTCIIPGNAKESILYQKLQPNPPFGRWMPPPKKLKLTPEQIDLIRLWIDQGAKNNWKRVVFEDSSLDIWVAGDLGPQRWALMQWHLRRSRQPFFIKSFPPVPPRGNNNLP
jgi:hypothetical protein